MAPAARAAQPRRVRDRRRLRVGNCPRPLRALSVQLWAGSGPPATRARRPGPSPGPAGGVPRDRGARLQIQRPADSESGVPAPPGQVPSRTLRWDRAGGGGGGGRGLRRLRRLRPGPARPARHGDGAGGAAPEGGPAAREAGPGPRAARVRVAAPSGRMIRPGRSPRLRCAAGDARGRAPWPAGSEPEDAGSCNL